MRSKRLRHPSPGFLIGAIALFVALGGTGYAATHSGSSPTRAQVKKMIASYVTSHKKELIGPSGGAGTNGAPGQPGAAGPGAIPIQASLISPEEKTGIPVGPWTVGFSCSASVPNSAITVRGPGTWEGTVLLATGNNPGNTYVQKPEPIGSGFLLAADNGAQLMSTLFLQSGSTLYELKTEITATNGGLFTECTLLGDAIPVP